jgi:RNA polymerase sigma-70 factor (ECF subfamily)
MDDALRREGEQAVPGEGAEALETWVCARYEEHGRGLLRYLTRMVGDAAVAEDLAQDVFVRLLEEMNDGRTVKNLRPWLYQVGHNLAIDSLRKERHEPWPAVEAETREEADRSPDAESTLLQAERRNQVRRGLSLLSAQERQALELRAEGLKYREIADLMELQVSTIATFLSRAVNKISRQIHG